MFPLQCRELLTKGQVFKKEATTSQEEPKKYADQEPDDIRQTLEMLVRAYDPCISCATHLLEVKFV